MNKPEEYTLHSGGAVGSDYEWEVIGRKYGLINFNHYYYKDKTPYGNYPITDDMYNEGVEHVHKANEFLNRKPWKYLNILSRNWFQVKNSDAVFAVAKLKSCEEVLGGTGWACQMAIDNEKPVYVFDEGDTFRGLWCKYNYLSKRFIPLRFESVPELTKNFAGIGTRNISDLGKRGIELLYKVTFRKDLILR